MPLPASRERIALSIAAFSSGCSDLIAGIKLGPLRPVAIDLLLEVGCILWESLPGLIPR
jgi:hypothetical protein